MTGLRVLKQTAFVILCFALGTGFLSGSQQIRLVEGTAIGLRQSTKLPLYFEPNKGQLAPGVQFFTRGRGYFLHLRSSEIEFWLLDARPTNKLVAAPGAELFSERQLPPAPRVKVSANFLA